MYQNALVATDGSEIAAAMLKHVAQVVDPQGKVTVIEVVDDIGQIFARTTPAGFEFGASGMDPTLSDSIVKAQRQTAEQHLAEARAVLERAGLTDIETVVLSGLPGDVVVREVDRRGADVVLMGTHGRSGLQRAVLGSVADHVLRHLNGVPVLLVPGRD